MKDELARTRHIAATVIGGLLVIFSATAGSCGNENTISGPLPTPTRFTTPTQVATPIPPTPTPRPATLQVVVSVTLNDNGHIVAFREAVRVSAQGRAYTVYTTDNLNDPARFDINDLTPNQYFVVTAQVENDPCISTYSSDSIILLPGANSSLPIGLRDICPH